MSPTNITQFCTVWSWYMRKRIDHWCSVVPEKSQPSGPPFSGKLGKPRFPLERWALWLGFFCPHRTPMMDSIYLTYPYQPVGKKKKQTAACRPPAGHMSIRDVIVMLKWRHHIASLCIWIFWKSFFMFHQYKMRNLVVSKKKNPLFVWGLDRKICP